MNEVMPFHEAIDYQEYFTWTCRVCQFSDRVKYELESEAERWAREHWRASHGGDASSAKS